MFTPDRLVDVSIFVGENDVEAVSAALMREGALHLEAQDTEQWAPAPRWAELADVYRAMVARLEDVRDALGLDAHASVVDIERARPLAPSDAARDDTLTVFDPRPTRDRLDLESDLLRFEARVGGWQDEASAAQAAVTDLTLAARQLELLAPLEAPVEDLRTLRHEHITIGTLPAENVARVAAALFQVPFVLLPLERRGARTLVAAATAAEDAHVLDRALRSAFFEPVELPAHVTGRPPEALATVRADLEAARAHQEGIATRGDALAGELRHDLLTTLDRARRDLELCEVLRRFPFRDGIYVVAGWLPERGAEEVADRLRAVAKDPIVIESLPLARGTRNVPTLMRNPKWLKPFESLATTFGLAGYDELNPTLVAAIVFLFMYGMMFGDIGHGAILLLAGLALARRMAFGIVIAAAGASATLFGVAYGVAFGAEVMHALWLRPMHAIFPLLISAVVAGVVILNLGFALNLVSAWRNRDMPRFWLDKNGVLGIALYWALLGGGAAVFLLDLPTGVWMLMVAPLALAMWFREPLAERMQGHAAPFGAHALTGFFELFESIIAYLSNTLSFVRLGAFAVAHEGLSSMVLRYASGPTGWIVLVFGTLVIVGFEGLIVGIQALRLQYYEFFGRFFQGRGRPFQALAFEGGPDGSSSHRS